MIINIKYIHGINSAFSSELSKIQTAGYKPIEGEIHKFGIRPKIWLQSVSNLPFSAI